MRLRWETHRETGFRRNRAPRGRRSPVILGPKEPGRSAAAFGKVTDLAGDFCDQNVTDSGAFLITPAHSSARRVGGLVFHIKQLRALTRTVG